MFNDERISLQIGKIYKKANFIVILIASIFFIARAMFYLLETGSLPISLFRKLSENPRLLNCRDESLYKFYQKQLLTLNY